MVSLPEGNPLYNETLYFSNDNDTAPSISPYATRDEELAMLEVATLSIIFALTIIGNIAMVIALAARKIKMTRMYFFLMHLCVADLITAFFNVLPQLAWDVTHRFYGGNELCKTVKYFQIFGPYLSSYILVVTAIDRYQAICFPMMNYAWTSLRSNIMVTAAWIISLLFCIPQIFIFSYQEIPWAPNVYDCWGTFIKPWGEKAYVLWYALSVFFFPLVILTFTYVCICRTVWQNYQQKRRSSRVSTNTSSSKGRQTSPGKAKETSKIKTIFVWKANRFRRGSQVEVCIDKADEPEDRPRSINPRTHSVRGLSRAKMKTIKITVVVIVFYILCSMPFICVQLWAYWYPNAQKSSIWKGSTVTILMLLSNLNSCVNPWIYLFFNQTLLNRLKDFCFSSCKKKNRNLNSEMDNANSLTTRSTKDDNISCTFTPSVGPTQNCLAALNCKSLQKTCLEANTGKSATDCPVTLKIDEKHVKECIGVPLYATKDSDKLYLQGLAADCMESNV